MRLAVFASGRGSNFRALLEARQAGRLPSAEFAILFSDNPDAPALDIARAAGIETVAFSPKDFDNRHAYETAILERLIEVGVQGICLAGYMRLVGRALLEAFPMKILNIHPALLPAFPGLHAQADAVAYGVKISGCTVHFVDSGVDTGPIIVQRAVAALAHDTAQTLAARILLEEHQAYREAVDLFTRGCLRVQGRAVHVDEDIKSP